MKFNRLSVAMAATALLGAGNAFALAPGAAVDIEIWASGATAQDKGVEALFSELCVAGTLDIYRDNANASKPGAQHSAYFCTLDSTKVTGLSTVNPNVLFHKRSQGGSAQGVTPLVLDQAITHMQINNGNCSKTAPDSFYRCTLANAGDTILHESDLGVSDVNPDQFRGVNAPIEGGVKQPDVTASQVSSLLDVTPAAGLVFGIPVTLSLYTALQDAQMDQGRIPAGCALGDDSNPDCMPSLSSEQVASLLAGKVQNWNRFKVQVGGASSDFFTSYSGGMGLTDNKVAICRRVDGSGTQAQANSVFLNNPCMDGAVGPVSTSNALSGPIVPSTNLALNGIGQSGSGDVDNCLADFNDGTNTGGGNSGNSKRWAIGIQSLEKNSGKDKNGNSIARKNYRFVKIDGAAPTLAEVAAGRYPDWVEQTFQWRKASVGGPTGDVLTVLQKVAQDASKPSIVKDLNVEFNHPFGQSGFLALSTNGTNAQTFPFDAANNPTINLTHKQGASLDNCRAPVVNTTSGKNLLDL
ncbi:type 2 periplasmic-binding domain-containing protein [Methylocaldum gracile]|jgi:ABC-type phosphate transport system substrate-binding protein|uniref:hypothetical protein n=1 Tax=Methylocaldum sp. 0917 TaxID=2485163 RepID=UPI001061F962